MTTMQRVLGIAQLVYSYIYRDKIFSKYSLYIPDQVFFNLFYMTEKAESKRFSFDKEGLTSYCEFQKTSDIF